MDWLYQGPEMLLVLQVSILLYLPGFPVSAEALVLICGIRYICIHRYVISSLSTSFL